MKLHIGDLVAASKVGSTHLYAEEPALLRKETRTILRGNAPIGKLELNQVALVVYVPNADGRYVYLLCSNCVGFALGATLVKVISTAQSPIECA